MKESIFNTGDIMLDIRLRVCCGVHNLTVHLLLDFPMTRYMCVVHMNKVWCPADVSILITSLGETAR